MGVATTANKSVVFFSSLGSFTFGYMLSAVSGLLGLNSFLSYFDIDTAGANAVYAARIQGALNGVVFGAAAIGAYGVAWLADRVGRKKAFQIICATSLTATIISTSSINIGMLLAGRTITGLSCGMLHTLCPVYQSEVSSSHNRGVMVGMHGFMFVSGLAGSAWVTLGCFFLQSSQLQWRLVLGMQALPTLALASSSFWLIESPRWLQLRNREEESLAALRTLHRDPGSDGHAVADAEHEAIKLQIELDGEKPTGLLALLKSPGNRKRLLLGAAIMFANQSSGQIVLYSYQVTLLQSLGVTGWLVLFIFCWYQTFAGCINFLGGWMSDRFGRKTMFLGGMIGSWISVIGHTAMIAAFSGTSNKVGQGAGIAFLFLFITFFATGVDVTTYIYASEIWPTNLRATGMATSIFIYFVQACIWSGVAPTAYATIGWKFYINFIVLSFVSIIIIWSWFPETANVSLEEIALLFDGHDTVQVETVQLSAEEANGKLVEEEKSGVR